MLEVEHAALASHVTSCRLLFVVPLFVSLGTLECWGGRQEECGPELCVRQLRVCGSQLAVCLVSLFVSVCRSCVSSSSVQRPPIPRWCPVRAWLFFTFLPTYLPHSDSQTCNTGSQPASHKNTTPDPRRTSKHRQSRRERQQRQSEASYDVSYSGARVRGANLSDRPEAF